MNSAGLWAIPSTESVPQQCPQASSPQESRHTPHHPSSCMALMPQYIYQCSKPLHAFHALEDHTACHDVGVFPVWDPVLLNGFFQDGIGVVWVCFVPFRTVFVWCGFVLYLSGRYLCGFVLYHCGLVSCFFVFVVYNLKHTGHFSHQK